MRIHLGHHFYGAGNLGDDFMLAGFLAALRGVEPAATLTCCVPFPLAPLQQRFPSVTWLPYEAGVRARCIQGCDAWIGLGGSPFQSAQSRWFVDHLVAEAETCAHAHTPMFFLGIGVQAAGELNLPEVRRICAQSAGIWTRDPASAGRIRELPSVPEVSAAADLAHVFFRETPPPPALEGRLAVVANFDFGRWPGQSAFLAAARKLPARERVWLAQESRDLPGAERALYSMLQDTERVEWRLVTPDDPGAPLARVVGRWPSAGWLVTSRYHAALAGAWAGSRTVVIATNEKLRAAARELNVVPIAPEADEAAVASALQHAPPATPPHSMAESARNACAALVRSAVAHQR